MPGTTTGQRVRVVITGMGMVTPVGIGKDMFWDRLIQGVSGVRRITRFDASESRVQIAAEVDGFDPRDWLDHKDAMRFDRTGQLALAAAELAVRDRGLTGLDLDELVTIVSCGVGGASSIVAAAHDHLVDKKMVSPLFIPMAMANWPASAIAFRYKLGGPCYAPLSACASSADAIGQGFRMIRDGYATACLAGGTEAAINALVIAGFASMRALSRRNDDPQRAGRPFAADRDGFVLGEGACILMLESLTSARKRGAHIYAEVCGYGQATDTHHLTAPRADGEGARKAMTLAIREAGLKPNEIQYINAHGTGTKLSDPAETTAVRRTFGEHAALLAISSTKAMTGHMLGATGAVEAAICALAIDRGAIPPTINLQIPDPECDLDYVPNTARQQKVDVALTNSIAFGGHNVTLALRRYVPDRAEPR